MKKNYFKENLQNLPNILINNPIIFFLLMLCLLGIFSFAELASEVLEGESKYIDTQILKLLRDQNNIPLGPSWLQEVMRDLTALGGIGILTLITITSALYMIILKKNALAIYIIVAIITGILFSTFLKLGFNIPRPDIISHCSLAIMSSFPSGHSLMAALVYLTLGVLIAEIQSTFSAKLFIIGLMIFITMLVGISRLYLGVHWPSDVLAGWIAGTVWALMALVIKKLIRL